MENIHDWNYRCEGNAGIVISNRKKVLRLVKLPNDDISKKTDESTSVNLKNTVMNQLSFAEHVIKPLMIRNFIVPMRLVHLAPDFAEEISIKIQSYRPAHRLAKGIPPELASAIEMPDLCFLPTRSETLSIEIKPKWGYLPECDDVFEVKKHVCRYCMQQAEKVLSGKYSERSFYCPIDLFSGCSERMAFAVAGLMRNPQNNCRVFKDGHIILSEFDNENFEEEVASWMKQCFPCSSLKSINDVMDQLIKMVVQCLLLSPPHPHHLVTHRPQQCLESKFNHQCTEGCTQLGSHSVLSCILDCQKLDEDLNLKKMLQLHDNVLNHLSKHIGTREGCGVDGPFNDDWLNSSCKNEVKEDILDIKKFLAARSAKDCSIIISLAPTHRRHQSHNDVQINESGDHLFYLGNDGDVMARMTIIDVDVKKFDKIPFYYDEDVNIVNTYRSHPLSP